MARLKLDVAVVAATEMAEALAYYGDISAELRQQFDESLESALVLLCESPHIGSRRFSYLYRNIELRTWSIDRFPFRLFYAVHGTRLVVYRMRHERRNVPKTLLRGVK